MGAAAPPGQRSESAYELAVRWATTTSSMAFKPNRELLNVNFEEYELTESLLSHVSKDLAEEVQVARLTTVTNTHASLLAS